MRRTRRMVLAAAASILLGVAGVIKFIDTEIRNADPYMRMDVRDLNLIAPDAAIAELNQRFRQHRIGYEFATGELIKINSRYIHSQVLRPALQLLQDAGTDFSGPLDEFLKAHEHHRQGNLKDAIHWSLKAFESTLKAICVRANGPSIPRSIPPSSSSIRSMPINSCPIIFSSTSAGCDLHWNRAFRRSGTRRLVTGKGRRQSPCQIIWWPSLSISPHRISCS